MFSAVSIVELRFLMVLVTKKLLNVGPQIHSTNLKQSLFSAIHVGIFFYNICSVRSRPVRFRPINLFQRI